MQSILKREEGLAGYFVPFMLEDGQPWPELCRWAKDHELAYAQQRPAATRIFAMLTSLDHEFDIFAGLLAILRLCRDCPEVFKGQVDLLQSMMLEQNMYIVHAAMQAFLMALTADDSLRARRKVL